MKKLIITCIGAVACLTGFGQGKSTFSVDSLHLLYFDPNPVFLKPADAGLAGKGAAPTTPSGVTLVADLYVGTSAATLSYQGSTTISNGGPGQLVSANINLSGVPPSTVAYYQVQVHDVLFPNAGTAWLNGSYGGFSDLFTAVPHPLVFFPIWNPNPPVNSTWAPGTFNLDVIAPGDRGAILISTVPEPALPAFVCFGGLLLAVVGGRFRFGQQT